MLYPVHPPNSNSVRNGSSPERPESEPSHEVRGTELDAHAHPLCPLKLQDVVQVQNQAGNHPNKWDKSGSVIEILPHDAYLIRIDGSGRVTKHN